MKHNIPTTGKVKMGRGLLDCVIYGEVTKESLEFPALGSGTVICDVIFLETEERSDEVMIKAEVIVSPLDHVPADIIMPLSDKPESVGDYTLNIFLENPD